MGSVRPEVIRGLRLSSVRLEASDRRSLRPPHLLSDGAGENGALCGLVPLVFLASRGFGRFLVSLPFVNYGGMIADSAEGCRLLEAGAIEQAKVLDAQHIELRHEAPWRRRGFRQNEKSRCVFPCPLRTKIC